MMMKTQPPSSVYPLIYDVVRQVPAGRVTTYGQVAAIVGRSVDARVVGYAMAGLTSDLDVPWQRVINSQGKISLTGRSAEAQHQMLEAEGIVFDADGRVDLDICGWEGPEDDFIAQHGLNPAPSLKRDDRQLRMF
jgi:methylated-DNA-protein-cysteine methyltransferase-like protein